VSEAEPLTSPAPAASDSKSSPFGAARPVDTAAKEKAVEEKRQLAIRQKREADEKAKAEKAEEKRAAKEKAEAEKKTETPAKEDKEAKDSTASKEDDEETAQPTPKYDILRRADSGMNDMVEEGEGEDEAPTQAPVDDKAVKPAEVVVPASSTRTNGAWRGGPTSQAPEGTTTAALEEDGWSTVSKPTKQRNNRRNVPSRAVAS